jgi:hypothetical protein
MDSAVLTLSLQTLLSRKMRTVKAAQVHAEHQQGRRVMSIKKEVETGTVAEQRLLASDLMHAMKPRLLSGRKMATASSSVGANG